MALLISNEDAQAVLDMKDCVACIDEGVREYYRGDAACRPRIDVWAPCGDPKGYYQWGSMEGTNRRFMVFATRIKSDIAYWLGQGEARTQEKYCQRPGRFCGLILLFSLENGEPLAIINDGIVQHMRVGATAGLGAKYLAREDARTVGMLGSGGMARTHASAFCEVRKIRRIKVFSPTPEHREAYAREMAAALEIEVTAVGSAEEAVKGAEIVAACTDSTVPVLQGKWIEPGAFISTINGTREVDDEALKRTDLFMTFAPRLELLEPVGGEAPTAAHRISGMHRAYVAGQPEDLAVIPQVQRSARKLDPRKVISFKDLVSGEVHGRVNAEQIISLGGNQIQGIQFASVGGLVYQRARAKGLGKEFPTDWLLQDIRN